MDLGKIQGCENNRWCGALMVNDETINPYAYDWNAVFLYYCDGASWIGNQKDPVSGLYFRGWQSLQAVMTDLLTNHDLNHATEVLIGGDSAGGLATFFHIDYMRDRINAAAASQPIENGTNSGSVLVLGMPDSGYWPDMGHFASGFRNMFKMQNGTAGLHANCVATRHDKTNMSQCLFPQYFAPLIETPLWPLQGLFDPTQKSIGPTREGHGLWLLTQIQKTILANPQNGGWVHSCERHCGAELLTIDGVQAPEAVQMFLHQSQSHTTNNNKRFWLQNKTYPCKDCCNDEMISVSNNNNH